MTVVLVKKTPSFILLLLLSSSSSSSSSLSSPSLSSTAIELSLGGSTDKTSWIAAVRRQSNNVCVTAVLRSIPKEAFADSFQKLYERCQPCVVKDGDYFEGQ
jgi:hypothetical protein